MRRKHLSLLLAAAVSLFWAPAALAQMPVGIGVLAGASLPLGDFGDFAETGWHAGLMVNIPTPGPVGIRIEGVYDRFGSSVDDDVDLTLLSATGNVVFGFPIAESTPMRPYLAGGVGVYRMDCTNCGDPDAETKFGLNGGIGVEFPLTGLSALVEARYHTIFTEDENTNFLRLSFGLFFR